MNFCQVIESFERQPKHVMRYSAGTEEAQVVLEQVFKQGHDMIKLYYRKKNVGAECQVDWGAKRLESGE